MKFVIVKGRVETIPGAPVPRGDEENTAGRLPQRETVDGYHAQLYLAVQGELCRFCQWLEPASIEIGKALSSYFEILL